MEITRIIKTFGDVNGYDDGFTKYLSQVIVNITWLQ